MGRPIALGFDEAAPQRGSSWRNKAIYITYQGAKKRARFPQVTLRTYLQYPEFPSSNNSAMLGTKAFTDRLLKDTYPNWAGDKLAFIRNPFLQNEPILMIMILTYS